uniref:Rhomboid protease n=1 Tax=Caenorhabditis japonica TaxID=281687 RepID=A0A8R1DEI0_CAEJA
MTGEKGEGEEVEDHRYIHIIRIGSVRMDDKWREAAPVNDIETSSWIRIFRAFDTDHDGLIQCEEMQKTIRDSTYSFGFDHYELQKMSLFLEMREGKPVDFADFCYLILRYSAGLAENRSVVTEFHL